MPLLLCRQKAKLPFYYEKLNVRLWSAQELCYLIVRYPLLTLGDLPTEDLLRWISRELLMPGLSARLAREQAAGESRENQLLLILQECNYYDVNEINAYRQRVMELRKYSRDDYLREVGVALFDAGRLALARDSFREACAAVDERLRKSRDPVEKNRFLRKKAEIYLDLAAVSMRLFEERRALDEIAASELFCRTKRALRMTYLITGGGQLPDEERKAAEAERKAAETAIETGAAYKALQEIFRKDSVKRKEETGAQLLRWKQEYRRML